MEFLDKFFYDKNFFNNKNVRLAIGSIALLVVFVLAFFAHKWYRVSVEQRAQKAFSDSMEVYKQAMGLELSQESDNKNQSNIWEEVEIAFKTAYLQNKSSSLAPFLLIYQSESLIRQGKKEEGYKILSEAVNHISKSSPYYYFYKIKESLMKFDMNESEKALQELNKLGNDKSNPFRDLANYYLGEYYWSDNNFDKSKEYFQKLMANQQQNVSEKVETPWFIMAKLRLQQLDK